jgi:hypothetical protein
MEEPVHRRADHSIMAPASCRAPRLKIAEEPDKHHMDAEIRSLRPDLIQGKASIPYRDRGASMASFVEYRENAAECARLALIAPSETGRASFAAAAKHWAMLYWLAAANLTGAEYSVASGRSGTASTG